MTMETTTKETASQGEFYQWASAMMEKRRVIGVEELEDAIAEQFKGRLPQGDMPNGKRTLFQNQVDWVKARWTNHGETKYVNIGDCRCIVWLEPEGRYDGVGGIVSTAEAWKTIRAVAGMQGE